MTNVLKEAAKRLSKDHMDLDPFPGDQASSGTDDHSNVTSANNEARTSKRPRIDCGGATAGHDDQGDQLLASLVALATEEDPVKQQQQDGDARCKESVVTDTFQGRFRSTVVCCTCKHVSVTYEPFMYLSVPLPRALERVVDVVFVPAWNESAPTRHQIVVQQYDKVRQQDHVFSDLLDMLHGLLDMFSDLLDMFSDLLDMFSDLLDMLHGFLDMLSDFLDILHGFLDMFRVQ